MIVVFVVDTSPSMAEVIKNNGKNNYNRNKNNTSHEEPSSGMTKLDLAKMTVESITKMMDRRIHEHNAKVQEEQQQQQQQQQQYSTFGLGGFCMPDQYLLLSTGVQSKQSSTSSDSVPSSVTCEAGGRLLVGFGEYNEKQNEKTQSNQNLSSQYHQQSGTKHEAFEKELKLLKPTIWKKIPAAPTLSSSSSSSSSSFQQPFPQDGGGANGLNMAISSGLHLLSRYRLHHSGTENFGMGRLPTNYNLVPNLSSNTGNMLGMVGKQNTSQGTLVQVGQALQPACLILLTDGECLRRPKSEGGGSMQLQFNLPLRDLYRERKFVLKQ